MMLLIPLLCIVRLGHTGEFVSLPTITEKTGSAMGELGKKLPIPDFEDFRPFLETSGVVLFP